MVLFPSFLGKFCVVWCANAESSLISVNYRDGSISHLSFITKRRTRYSFEARNECIFIFGSYDNGRCLRTCEKLDTTNGGWVRWMEVNFGELTQLPHMPSARFGSSALSVPDVGIIVVGRSYQTVKSLTTLNNAEALVEDVGDTSGWRWIELKPMLWARHRPGITYFNGCVVVAGGHLEFSAKNLPLTSIEQATAQWIRLHGVCEYGLKTTSLVPFNSTPLFLHKPLSSTHSARVNYLLSLLELINLFPAVLDDTGAMHRSCTR